ncbi:MAG TPA: tyrosine-type recombinase/integrase [Acidimicrobiales bacterium]|nr:tyrosine-type recombinase/integrase [Acidimicrobiales bacterium]
MSLLAPVLEGYFTERLAQRRASSNTVAAYRDTYCLLLAYAQRRVGKVASSLELSDVDAALVGGFLDHLEVERHNGVATRNARLAAIHSLYRYAALRCPEHAGTIQRVLAIPPKRTTTTDVSFLAAVEVAALLECPDRTTRAGRRDHALLLVAVQTGLRVSELTGLTCVDVELGTGANVHCVGKGRKERRTPLTRDTARVLGAWLRERERGGEPTDPLFPSRSGGRLSRDAVADLLAKHLAAARTRCPSLSSKRVSPHTLRHTAAMRLLWAGVDTSTIALWLGHAGTKATEVYLHADLSLKERALARTSPLPAGRGRYRPSDELLAFLQAL